MRPPSISAVCWYLEIFRPFAVQACHPLELVITGRLFRSARFVAVGWYLPLWMFGVKVSGGGRVVTVELQPRQQAVWVVTAAIL